MSAWPVNESAPRLPDYCMDQPDRRRLSNVVILMIRPGGGASMAIEPFISVRERPDLTLSVDPGSTGAEPSTIPLSDVLGEQGEPAAKLKEAALEKLPIKDNALEKFPWKEHKDAKDHKEHKEQKDHKDPKEQKDQKDQKDPKDTKDQKDHKDPKEHKDSKDHKDLKEHKDSKDHKDLKEQAKELKEPFKDRAKEIEKIQPDKLVAEPKGVVEGSPAGPLTQPIDELVQRVSGLEQDVAALKAGGKKA